jgi:hypothetical protein
MDDHDLWDLVSGRRRTDDPRLKACSTGCARHDAESFEFDGHFLMGMQRMDEHSTQRYAYRRRQDRRPAGLLRHDRARRDRHPQLYAKTGMFTYDPGFLSTAACKSNITYIDGDKGVLLYRGYPIEQLATSATSSRSPT